MLAAWVNEIDGYRAARAHTGPTPASSRGRGLVDAVARFVAVNLGYLPGKRFVDLVEKHPPPPLGLPQRSAGLTTTGQTTTAIGRFSSLRPPGPRAGRPQRGKTPKWSREVAFQLPILRSAGTSPAGACD